jgi:hypothetical protein
VDTNKKVSKCQLGFERKQQKVLAGTLHIAEERYLVIVGLEILNKDSRFCSTYLFTTFSVKNV